MTLSGEIGNIRTWDGRLCRNQGDRAGVSIEQCGA
jgi:hypothetical protein